jgi:hypothetical protein
MLATEVYIPLKKLMSVAVRSIATSNRTTAAIILLQNVSRTCDVTTQIC